MKLSDYLIDKQLSPAAFARIIEVGRMSVHRYINGDRFPRPDVLQRIQQATQGQVTPNDFLPAPGSFPGSDHGDLYDTDNTASASQQTSGGSGVGGYPWSRVSAEEQRAVDEAYEAMMKEPPEGSEHSPVLQTALHTLGDRVAERRGQFVLDRRPVRISSLIEQANALRQQEGLPPLHYPNNRN